MTEPTTAAEDIQRATDQLSTPMAQWLAANQIDLMPGLRGCVASTVELLAIEQQAVAAALARVREAMRRRHQEWCSCLIAACDCGRDAAVLDIIEEDDTPAHSTANGQEYDPDRRNDTDACRPGNPGTSEEAGR